MIYIAFIPFPVCNDTLVVNNNEVYKICKSQIEFEEEIENISKNEEDSLVFTYHFPINYKIGDSLLIFNSSDEFGDHEVRYNAKLFIADLLGGIHLISKKEDVYGIRVLCVHQKTKFDIKKYPSQSDIPFDNDTLFSRELKYQLRSEYYNYAVKNKLNLDKVFVTDNGGSIKTCLDLFRYIINTKYVFLGDICAVIHKTSYLPLYDDIFRKNELTKDVVTVYDTTSQLLDVKEYLDNTPVTDIEISYIPKLDFITENDYRIHIDYDRNITVEKNIMKLSKKAKMNLR